MMQFLILIRIFKFRSILICSAVYLSIPNIKGILFGFTCL